MYTSIMKLIINNFNILICWLIFFMYASIMEYTNLTNAQETMNIYSCIHKLISVYLCENAGTIFASIE